MPRGIDISEFNGNFNIRGYQPDFVIIRAGDGNYWDARLDENVNKCIDANIPYGLYWLIRDWKISDSEQTAANICKYANTRIEIPTVGIWCDVEDEYDDDPAKAIPFVDAFCRTIEDEGYYSGIYCNQHYYQSLYPNLERFDCWNAVWDDDPHDDPGYGTMKQYSNSDGKLDLDVSFVPLSIYDLKHKEPAPPSATLEDRVKVLEDKIKLIERILS